MRAKSAAELDLRVWKVKTFGSLAIAVQLRHPCGEGDSLQPRGDVD
ncbi:hypothetical protein [Paludisphaera soli]|nr:hypothetical protein [Paludisphaera soli]